ncbi:NAD-dependent epimerase/dehydratase family protein [Rubinisphaera margarita]|uniref:NAD-dependent epimerase/dehydratase family protein n=1 Tax=Rubinisphaera margarita TaxID=2909586 RepID=UPI001EE90FEF|nr:NAD(P)-dependent oxidoreductase [Rubinisphaera margarita]MCG6158155.1 NAD(P)-dependent oxidoreductase [Rubinisphaera margarita]
MNPGNNTSAPSSDSSSRPVVVITGSCGLIGLRLARAWRDDYRLVGLDLSPPEESGLFDAFFETDLTEEDSIRSTMEQIRNEFGERIASVVHLAAYHDFSGEPSPLYDELTVQGTRRLLAALQNFKVEQFLFSSSLLAMEPDAEKELDESSPMRGEWAYPASKIAAERVIRAHHGEIPYVLARIAGGYDEAGHSPPITQQMARIYEKQMESYVFPGNPEHGNTFIHLDDLTTCLKQIVDRRHDLAREEIFLIAEPEVVSYGELQDLFGDAFHGTEWPTFRVPAPVAKAGAWVKGKIGPDEEQFIKPWMVDLADHHYEADISHARESLDWEPKHSLRSEIPKMAEQLKADPEGWYEANGIPAPDSISRS